MRNARFDEIKQLSAHGVYEKVPAPECWNATGKKPSQMKWADINKGDEVHPEYRSGLVAKAVKMDKRNDLFAATPPFEGASELCSNSRNRARTRR